MVNIVSMLRAGAYVRKIRNPKKREYAGSFLKSLLEGLPEPERGELS